MRFSKNLITLMLLGFSAFYAQAQDDELLKQSRNLSLSMLKELGAKLQSSMAEGGAINAIGVCHLQAPEIANRVSTENQVIVSRVGTRTRNPVMGVPNAWQAKALAQFEAGLARGDKPADMEYSETVTKPDGGKEFHFAKPVLMQPMCLACHGNSDQINPEVKAKLSELYPNDKAINYQAGQLRGAVVLTRQTK
ncbi:MAG: DUF3365 domain-containing protein [Burkholderiales bacterium]|nr:DUF3365 domain-containing protein [Burkholderiales bacterium]